MSYVDEFLFLGTIALLGAISPGPDFVVITQNSLRYGKKVGIYTALGVAASCLVHATYCVVGIDFIVDYSAVLFTILKYVGAAYMIYLGIKGLRAQPITHDSHETSQTSHCLSVLAAFKKGFLVNILNVKLILFYISMFTLVIDPETPKTIQMLYGIEFSLIGFIWFSLLTIILNNPLLKKRLLAVQHWVERCLGVVLIIFGLKIATLTQG